MKQAITILLSFSTSTYRVLAILWLLLTLALSLMSQSAASQLNLWDIVGLDKLGHLGFYMVLCFLWCMVYQSFPKMMHVVIAIILFGVLMEVCQYLLRSGRAFELLDVLANTIGALLGYGVFLFLTRIKTNFNP